MKKFWSFISNGEYSVGCTGQTVYLYNKNGDEISKFKDLIYAYHATFSPDGKIFVVKSGDGRLAVYSLETLSLIKKFRYSKVDYAQDDGFCFSPQSDIFVNIERQKDDLHSAISFYNTVDFSLIHQTLIDDGMMVDHIEFDQNTGSYYVLGYDRNRDEKDIFCFVAKLDNHQIINLTPLSELEYDFYSSYLDLRLMGFTEKAYAWSYIDCDLDKLKTMNHTLAKLYMWYNK